MPYSEAQKKATLKYRDKAYDRMEIQAPKGMKAIYQELASSHGLSLNAYIIQLLERERESPKK